MTREAGSNGNQENPFASKAERGIGDESVEFDGRTYIRSDGEYFFNCPPDDRKAIDDLVYLDPATSITFRWGTVMPTPAPEPGSQTADQLMAPIAPDTDLWAE